MFSGIILEKKYLWCHFTYYEKITLNNKKNPISIIETDIVDVCLFLLGEICNAVSKMIANLINYGKWKDFYFISQKFTSLVKYIHEMEFNVYTGKRRGRQREQKPLKRNI